MKFETARKVTMALLVITCVLCLLALVITQEGSSARDITSYIALGTAVLGIICLFSFCKCPYCGKRLFRNMANIKVCPACHRDLETGIKKKGKGGKR